MGPQPAGREQANNVKARQKQSKASKLASNVSSELLNTARLDSKLGNGGTAT